MIYSFFYTHFSLEIPLPKKKKKIRKPKDFKINKTLFEINIQKWIRLLCEKERTFLWSLISQIKCHPKGCYQFSGKLVQHIVRTLCNHTGNGPLSTCSLIGLSVGHTPYMNWGALHSIHYDTVANMKIKGYKKRHSC